MHATAHSGSGGTYVLRELRPNNLPHLIRLYNHYLIPDRVLWDLASGVTAFEPTAFCGMVNHSATQGVLGTGALAPSLEQSWRAERTPDLVAFPPRA